MSPEYPSERDQTLNGWLYAATQWGVFLCAPVLYVDVVHTSLCNQLGASRTVANLPTSARILTALAAAIVAWLIPHADKLRLVVAASYGILIPASLAVIAALLLPVGPGIQIAAVVIHGGVAGGAANVGWVFVCEIFARGVAPARRSVVVGLTYTIGPAFALVGSLFSQWILGSSNFGLKFPWNYAIVFATVVPSMATIAIAALRFRVPVVSSTEAREPLAQFLFGGVWRFLRERHFLLLVASHLLLVAAFSAIGNVNLLAKETMGKEPQEVAGYMNALRFLGKILGGFGLGLVMGRKGMRAAALAASLLTCVALGAPLFLRGPMYLSTFLVLGAAELASVYYFNYGMAASPAHLVKRNMSFITLLMAPAALAPAFLGAVADASGLLWSLAVAFVMSAIATCLCLPLPGRREGGY